MCLRSVQVVMRYTDVAEYLSVADVIAEYILQNCTVSPFHPSWMTELDEFCKRILAFCEEGLLVDRAPTHWLFLQEVELGVLLRDIIKHVRKADVNDGVLMSLESIVFKLVTHYNDLSHVLTLVRVLTPLSSSKLNYLCHALYSHTKIITKHSIIMQGSCLKVSQERLQLM